MDEQPKLLARQRQELAALKEGVSKGQIFRRRSSAAVWVAPYSEAKKTGAAAPRLVLVLVLVLVLLRLLLSATVMIQAMKMTREKETFH